MVKKQKYGKSQALPIFIVLFLGYIGFSLVLPIFAPMLFNPKHGMLPSYHDEATRSIILGFLVAMYPLGQFFGCPFLGKLSDIYGRRIVLLISLACIVPFYILSGIAVSFTHISLLFFSRLMIGLFEGNIVIATAAIADISETHANKIKNFGWITAISSSGFIIGPLVGGKLADSELVPWFTYSTPFYMGSVLVALAWLVVYLLFKETKNAEHNLPFKPLAIIKKLYNAITYKHLRPVFFANFNIYMAFFFFFAFFPVLLVKQYHFSASTLAEVESYLAVCICMTPLLYKKFSKHFTPRMITAFAGFFFCIALLLLAFISEPKTLVFSLLLPSLCIATGFTYSSIMISDRISKEMQGEALGTNQSILVLSECLSGIFGGFLASIFSTLPMLIGAALALLSALWLRFRVRDETYDN